ncbi:hypothetical protein Psi02_37320 [Planotetraspora silvatica]|uniref:Uncharacterized protein n=1 Tax=Planotetraspora silvatica TaxID=234614 RepID=A0A8J3UK63_9ACTN|nr:hypothetical protein [Planotetraspora silvatica]GII47308.1 hypothetical protein Psi02_37320 [Planotetraspora silvatica]
MVIADGEAVHVGDAIDVQPVDPAAAARLAIQRSSHGDRRDLGETPITYSKADPRQRDAGISW